MREPQGQDGAMAIILGDHQYGKAENRIVRIVRDSPRHEIRDLNVSTCLRGGFDDAHLTGDQATVLPTDTQKQTAYAFAKTVGLASIEEYGLALAQHFVDTVTPVTGARVEIEEFAWERVSVAGEEHDHTWVRKGQEVRTASVTVEGPDGEHGGGVWVTGGLKDLVILKSTGSEFHGFLEDDFTVLEPTSDRVMATSLEAKWRFADAPADWDAAYDAIKTALVSTFATLHSLALQQSLFEMGKAAIEAVPELAEVRLSAPNKHHFLYDLGRFGIENNNEVFHADDRPYGLIQASVIRDDAPPAGPAWQAYSGLV
jgi:urate oxidase